MNINLKINLKKLPIEKRIEFLVTSGRTYNVESRRVSMLFSDDRDMCCPKSEPNNYNTALGLQINLASKDIMDYRSVYSPKKLAHAFDDLTCMAENYDFMWDEAFKLAKNVEESSLALYLPNFFYSNKQDELNDSGCGVVKEDYIVSEEDFYEKFKL